MTKIDLITNNLCDLISECRAFTREKEAMLRMLADLIVSLDNIDEVITVQEAAEILGISPRAVQQKCEQGKIKCRKAKGTWLILRSSL